MLRCPAESICSQVNHQQTPYQLGCCLALLFSFAALADVADTLLNIKPGVVGVGTFNPTGGPRANLLGTGFAVLNGQLCRIVRAHFHQAA